MGDFNVPDNAQSTIQFGHDAADIETTQLKTGTTAYPGSLLTEDTTVGESKVCTSILPARGWLVLEDTPNYYRKARTTDTYDGAFANDDRVGITRSAIGAVVKARVAKYSVLKMNEYVCNWAGGEVYGPCTAGGNGIWIGVPWVFNDNSVTSTGVILPLGVIQDALVEVTTVDATETMDFGLSTGDENGFVAAIDVATAGMTPCTTTITAGTKESYFASSTYGAFLVTVTAGSNTTTDVGTYLRHPYECAGTLAVCNTGTAGSDTGVGIIWFSVFHNDLQIVGQAMEAIDASAAATTGLIKSLI